MMAITSTWILRFMNKFLIYRHLQRKYDEKEE